VLATHVGRTPWTREPVSGVLEALWSRATADVGSSVAWLRRARCGLSGHAMVLRLEPDRISLQCLSCGEQTPGWTIGARRD
jgi:hypothetical protein